jgi:ribose transport system ATP-binding protein
MASPGKNGEESQGVHDASQAPALVLRGVAKSFQGQWALQDVDLELHAGEVHALLGQNGSGKSTLIKILAGYHAPEPGAIALRGGVPFELGSGPQAHASGIRFIHQDLAVIDELDVCDNVALGGHYQGKWWLSARRERAAVRRAFDDYGIDIDPAAPVRSLGPAQKTLTAIVRALHSSDGVPGVLVLDEPTVALSAEESSMLFDLVRRVSDRGGAILYVTHRLQEVFDIADRVTILRDGRRISTTAVAGLDEPQLVEMIIGRPLESLYPELRPARDDVVLSLDGITGETVRDLDLQVHSGEIVGVTGLMGSGVEELLHLVYGASPRRSGCVTVDGTEPGRSPHAAVAAGLAFAPGDRKRLGGIAEWTLAENVTLPSLRSRTFAQWMSVRSERKDAAGWLERFEVSPPDPLRTFSSLSGGNQQKTVLARWLRCGARVFLLQEPTQGVDIGAKAAIYTALADVAAEGAAVLLASTDAEELVAVCDRIVVLRNGRAVADLSGGTATIDRVIAETVRSDGATRTLETSHA